MEPLTKIDLDIMIKGGCDDPECKHKHELSPELYMTQQCHPKAGLYVKYDERDHLVHIECAVCELLVCKIKPADY